MSEDLKTKVKIDYLKGMKYNDICIRHDVKKNTLKSWIKRYKWKEEKDNIKPKIDKIKKGAPQNKKGCTLKNKTGAPYGNQNAKGKGAPKGNQNARKHGLFSKYLPAELNNIIEEIEEKGPAELLWDQILLSYSNILAAQKKLYVIDKEDMTKELKKEKESYSDSGSGWEKEYNIQFAWDKQNAALISLGRSRATFNNMIKTFVELERAGLVTEELKAKVNKLKVEVKAIEEKVNETTSNELVQIIDDIPEGEEDAG